MTEILFVFWYWWVLAVVFLVIEILVPAFFFLWMSVSAGITGVMVWLIPSTSTEIQVLVFSILSITSIVVWKVFVKKQHIQTDQPFLNKRGTQYVGRVYSLYEPIVNGQGKIKVDDSQWKVNGEDCPVGTKVKVIAIHGSVFDVEKVD